MNSERGREAQKNTFGRDSARGGRVMNDHRECIVRRGKAEGGKGEQWCQQECFRSPYLVRHAPPARFRRPKGVCPPPFCGLAESSYGCRRRAGLRDPALVPYPSGSCLTYSGGSAGLSLGAGCPQMVDHLLCTAYFLGNFSSRGTLAGLSAKVQSSQTEVTEPDIL
jgi:hypothetical protein